jgi:hypothetical protein
MSTATTTPVTTTDSVTVAARIVDPAAVTAAAKLTKMAEAAAATAMTASGGTARRMRKLARQLHTAAALLRNGRGLSAPGCLDAIHYLHTVTSADTAADVDYLVHRARILVVGLHEWRGHSECLPLDDRH